MSADALGARCGTGRVGATPDLVLSLDAGSDVELELGGPTAFAVVGHPDGSFDCVSIGQRRFRWEAGAHRVHVGVVADGAPGPYTLTARTVPSSLRPWAPR